MKIVIQVAAKDDARSWDLLQRHFPGVALPSRLYIVSEQAVRALAKAGVEFTEILRVVDLRSAPGPVG
jgi:hypothetical protein